MTTTFKPGDVVEFLGCELTSRAPCQAVTILNIQANGNIQVKFQAGSKGLNGNTMRETVEQIVTPNSLKHLPGCGPKEAHGFKVGDVVEFIGCELTQMAPCPSVRITQFTEEARVRVTFPAGSPKKVGEPCSVRLTQVVEIDSLIKPQTNPKEITTMSLKITTSHKVQNQETKDLTAEQQADMIAKQQQSIEALEKVKPKTKKITATIAELKQDLKLFIEHLDGLE